MANDSITFLCPACGIKLTVPGSLAGVIGPCPSCRSQIQAPYPVPTPAPAPHVTTGLSELTGAPPIQAMPAAAASQAAGLVTDPGLQTAVAVAATTAATAPDPVPPPAISSPPVDPGTAAALRPEPRQLPSRTSTADPIAKPISEAIRQTESAQAAKAHGRRPHSRNLVVRLLVPLLVILAMVGVVFGVLTLLNNKDDGSPPPGQIHKREDLKPATGDASTKPTRESGAPTLNALPVAPPELPIIVEPPPELPAGLDAMDAGKEAEDVLYAFLAAKNLADRIPIMETKTPEAELGKSSLAGPLPASSNVAPEFRETNAVEQVIDFYYSVDFDAGENRLDSHTILVRKRGSSNPKIVADPFLDSFGGRLAAYASKPTDKAGIFQVIASPLASCNDPKVPMAEKKYTLKLLPRDQVKEIARAYFGKQSRIGRMLEDRTYSLNFGKAIPCTVMLRWNTDDSIGTPFLEALDITSLDWNP